LSALPALPRSELPIGGTTLISGTLAEVRAPRSFICISQSWPSQLVTLLSLKLPVLAAYCPKRFHHIVRSLQPDLHLHGLDVSPSSVPSVGIYLVSGSSSFVSRFLSSDPIRAWSIVHVEMCFRDHPGHSKSKIARGLSNSALGSLGLSPVFFNHFSFGGATDGIYAWDLVGVWIQMSESDVLPFLHSAVLSGIFGRHLSLPGTWWFVIPLSLHAVVVTGMLIA